MCTDLSQPFEEDFGRFQNEKTENECIFILCIHAECSSAIMQFSKALNIIHGIWPFDNRAMRGCRIPCDDDDEKDQEELISRTNITPLYKQHQFYDLHGTLLRFSICGSTPASCHFPKEPFE